MLEAIAVLLLLSAVLVHKPERTRPGLRELRRLGKLRSQGLSYAEIGRRLKICEATVRNRIQVQLPRREGELAG